MGQNKRRGRSIIRPRLAVYTAAIEIIPHNHHDDRHTPDGAAAETGLMPRAGLCRIEF